MIPPWILYPQYMLLRYTPTCMLQVCNAIGRISCNFYSMAEIMAERNFCVNRNVQIRFQHFRFDTKIIPIGQVGTSFCEIYYFLTEHDDHVDKWSPC